MKRERGTREATGMKSWIQLGVITGKKGGKDGHGGGGRNDFFGNYLILNQSGMEKKSRNPQKSQQLKTLNNRNLLSDQTDVW